MEFTSIATPRGARRHLSRIGGTLVLLAVLAPLMRMAAQAVVQAFFPQMLHNSWGQFAVMMLPWYLTIVPVALLLLRTNTLGIPPKRRLRPGKTLALLPMSYSLVFLGSLMGNVVILFITLIRRQAPQGGTVQFLTTADPLPTFVFAVLLAPVIEEVLFRKFLVDALYPYGELPAILISGSAFGLFHGNFQQFFYAAMLGCLFAFVYCRTGNIWYTVGLHAFINFIGTTVSRFLLDRFDIQAMLRGDTSVLTKDPAALIGLLIYLMLLMALVVTGISLFIWYARKTRFRRGVVTFRARYVLNAGMIAYLALFAMTFLRSVFR